MTLFDFITVAIVSVSAFCDLRIRRIPNWLIVVGVISGFILNALMGMSHLLQSFGGFAVGILVLLLPFALGWIGAGDVKFFGVLGALLGVSKLPRVFFYSALVAGVIALGYLVFGLSKTTRFWDLWTDTKIAIMSFGHILPAPVHQRTRNQDNSVPWGVAFALGTIIAYYIDDAGRWAGF